MQELFSVIHARRPIGRKAASYLLANDSHDMIKVACIFMRGTMRQLLALILFYLPAIAAASRSLQRRRRHPIPILHPALCSLWIVAGSRPGQSAGPGRDHSLLGQAHRGGPPGCSIRASCLDKPLLKKIRTAKHAETARPFESILSPRCRRSYERSEWIEMLKSVALEDKTERITESALA